MYHIFTKKLVKQGIALILICGLAFSPVFGLDKSYGQEVAPTTTSTPETPVVKPVVEAPVISGVKKASHNSLKITWGKVSGANGYVLYRATSENGAYKKIATLKGKSKTSYTDKKKTTGKKYFYKVKAYKTGSKKVYSAYSAVKSGIATPNKTKFNKNTVYGYKTVTLKWNKSKGAKGYNIYRSTRKATGYKLVKTISGGSKLKWSNKKLNAKKTYYYKVVPYTKVNNVIVEGSASAVYKKKTVSNRIDKITKKYKNVPYVYGGNSPKGWDCSGFTQWSAKYISGKKIPRTAGAQAGKGKKISKTDRSKWQPGDILLYSSSGGGIGHAALYIGDNKIMHALNSRYDTVIQDVDYYEKWDGRTKLKYVRRY